MSHMDHLNHLKIPFQIINDCTQNFNEDNLIGKGGYGNVYKGILSREEHENQPVAVKRLDDKGFQGQKEFYTEITMLSQYRHKNIIALVGFCDEGKEMIVVYEYASHGSLDKYLTNAKMLDQLSWKRRLKICIGIASALDYLHNHVAAEHRVIHRDMKSANILLDEKWKPKLSDFGLSRIGLANQRNTFLITNVAGTHWYCDPQYEKTGILTKESDVYSFGVVLFEVLCGRLVCVMDYNDKRRFLHHLVRTHYKNGELETIVDYRIMDHIKGTKMSQFSAIAYRCLKETREERPPIHEVVLQLKKLKDTYVDAKILNGGHNKLKAIEELRRNIEFFSFNKSFEGSDGVVNYENYLRSKDKSRLEYEFKQLLSTYSKAVEPARLYECLPYSLRPSSRSPDASGSNPSNSHTNGLTIPTENAVYNLPVLIPPRVLPLLHDLAQEMAEAGYTQQCQIIYRDIRSQVLQESFHLFEVENLCQNDNEETQFEALEIRINGWIQLMRISVKLIFAAERKLFDQMFEGIDSQNDQCFADITKGTVAMLLSFGAVVAKTKSSAEKLFVLLDMYEVMRELQSEIEMLFNGKSCKEIREDALGLTKPLAQVIIKSGKAFEETVENIETGTTIVDGSVHPHTSYVITYVKYILDYQSTLTQLFQEFENVELASLMMRIMETLKINLVEKSKQYKDPALANFFLMNNIDYMVRHVRRSEAKDLLGDDWVQKHRRSVQQHANQYRRIAWVKIIQYLVIQDRDGGNSNRALQAVLKDRLKNFNLQFEELHRRQIQWTIPSSNLQESLRLAIAEVLLPPYKSFIKRFREVVGNEKYYRKYIKYTTEDLDRMLGEFFEGKG